MMGNRHIIHLPRFHLHTHDDPCFLFAVHSRLYGICHLCSCAALYTLSACILYLVCALCYCYCNNEQLISPSLCLGTAANKSDVSCEHQAEVNAASQPADTEVEIIKPSQHAHLIGKHMVLPFIPPKFINQADSNTLLKPSEYLKSICKTPPKINLAKAR